MLIAFKVDMGLSSSLEIVIGDGNCEDFGSCPSV